MYDIKKIREQLKAEMIAKVIFEIINRQISIRQKDENIKDNINDDLIKINGEDAGQLDAGQLDAGQSDESQSDESQSDAGQLERDLYLLTGLDIEYLKALSDLLKNTNHAQMFKGKTIAFKVSRKNPNFQIIETQFLTDESAVFFRHSTMANIILFAISDDELNTVGASLNPISRINRNVIQDSIDVWLNYIDMGIEIDVDSRKRWLKGLLKGINQSKITKNLNQFVEFIQNMNEYKDENWNQRVQLSLPALHLPKNSIVLKSVEHLTNIKGMTDRLLAEKFEQLFKTANREVACFLYLVDPYNRPINRDILRKNIENRFPDITSTHHEYETYQAITGLMKDYNHLRPGDWIDSQANFCEKVDWTQIEKDIFEKKEKPKNLGEMTHEFILAKHPDKEEDLKNYLIGLKSNQSLLKDDIAFFEKYKDEIEKYSKKLNNTWLNHLYPQEIKFSDLTTVFLKGIRALIIKANANGIEDLSPFSIHIFVKDAGKEEMWKKLDSNAHHFFKYEGQLIKSALHGLVELHFGDWLNEKIHKEKSQDSSLDFDFFLIEKELDDHNKSTDHHEKKDIESISKKHVVKVRATWLFSNLSKHFYNEVKELYDQRTDQNQTNKQSNQEYFLQGDDLHRQSSKQSNKQDQISQSPYQNYIEKININHLDELIQTSSTPACYQELKTVFNDFLFKYDTAIRAIHNQIIQPENQDQSFETSLFDQDQIFETSLFEDQAAAFGKLCAIVRKQDLKAYRKDVASIAIIKLTDPDDHILVPIWHPLRLLEKKVKLADFRQFIESLLSLEVAYENLDKLFKDREEYYLKWVFPEIISYEEKLYKTIIDESALSIAIPLETYTDYQQKQTVSHVVAYEYQKMIASYLNLYPHEETCFSTMIYNSENIDIPEQVILSIQKEMLKRDQFRCHLYLHHDEPLKRNDIYRKQNAKLQKIVYDETKETGISRLNVSMAEQEMKNIDILLLYQNLSNEYIQYDWHLIDDHYVVEDHKASAQAYLSEVFQRSMHPRITQKDGLIEYALSVITPPRAYSEFLNLCYSLEKEIYDLDGKRAHPIQYVSWKDASEKTQQLQKTLESVHNKANWVLSIDHMINSQLLLDHQIKVIRDISISHYDLKVLISSKNTSKHISKNIEKEFKKINYFGIDQRSKELTKDLLDCLVDVCGQKILGIANSEIATRELIGIYISTLLIKRELKQIQPIWISLDDHKSFFGLKGELADLLCIWVEKINDKFTVFLNVVEGKYRSNPEQILSACSASIKQIDSTLSTMENHFVNQTDLIALQSWGLSLLTLMNSKPNFNQFFKEQQDLEDFKSSVLQGKIDYILSGISVVIDYENKNTTESKDVLFRVENAITQYLLSQYQLACLLQAQDVSLKQSEHFDEFINHQNVDFPTNEYSIVEDTSSTDTPSTDTPSTDTLSTDTPSTDTSSIVAIPENHEDIHEIDISDVDVDEDIHEIDISDVDVDEDIHEIDISDIDEDEIQSSINKKISLLQLLSTIQNNRSDQITPEEEDNDLVMAHLYRALNALRLKAIFDNPRATKTPNGLIIHFKGELILQISNRKTLVDQLKTAFALNVIDIRLELGRLSFFIASKHRSLVPLEDVWLKAEWPENIDQQQISFLIGLREDNGKPLWLNLGKSYGGNLEHAPHTLIVGETGSGKGVLIQNILLQTIVFNDPKHLKLYLIDPKHGVDFAWIKQAPHLARPIATTQAEAQSIFNLLIDEMESRYQKFQQKGVSKLSEYNQMVSLEERLPICIMVHDEMADWMLSSGDYSDVVKSLVTRLATKARAAGIHLIMITQRASQESIPLWIRENLGNRLCLKVSNDRGSMLALGDGGAENLLGKGHLMAKLGGDRPVSSEYFIVQVPFASNETLKEIAKIYQK